MENKRVLHLKGTLSSDGATVVEYGFAREMTPEFVFDWLLEQTPEEGWKNRFQQTGSRFFEIQYPKHGKKKVLLKYRAYRDFFREHPYETIHIDTDGFHRTVELFAAKKAGIPRRIIHSHNTEAEVSGRLGKSGFSRWLGQTLYSWLATDYLACSLEAAEWLFGRKNAKSVTMLKNGIDVERFRFDQQKRAHIRAQLGLENRKVLGHVGRFEKQKNHRFLLSLFREIHERDQDCRLLLIGDGSLRSEIMEEARRMHLDQAVLFTGNIDHVEDYYQAMDLFLLPSLHEGLALVAVEAQCNGLPCLMADTVSPQTKITDSCVFLPIDRGTSGWVKKAEEMLEAPGIRENGARDIVAAGYDLQSSVKKLYEVYGHRMERATHAEG